MVYRERKNIRLKNHDYSSEGIYFITICCLERKLFFGKIENETMHLSDIGRIASQYWMEIPIHFPHVRLDEYVIMPNHLHGILILDYSMVGTCHGMSLRSPHDDYVGSRHGVALSSTNDDTIEPPNIVALPSTNDDTIKPRNIVVQPTTNNDAIEPRNIVAQPTTNGDAIKSCNILLQPLGNNKNQFSKPIKNSVSVIVNQFKSSVKRWCNKNGYNEFEWQSRFYDHIVYDEYSIQNIRAYIKNNPSNWKDDELFI